MLRDVRSVTCLATGHTYPHSRANAIVMTREIIRQLESSKWPDYFDQCLRLNYYRKYWWQITSLEWTTQLCNVVSNVCDRIASAT